MSVGNYRCVVANDSNEVIAIGMDENQGGSDYNGIGLWCSFVFDEIPQSSGDIVELTRSSDLVSSLLKVVDNQITTKTLEEVLLEIDTKQALNNPPQEL